MQTDQSRDWKVKLFTGLDSIGASEELCKFINEYQIEEWVITQAQLGGIHGSDSIVIIYREPYKPEIISAPENKL